MTLLQISEPGQSPDADNDPLAPARLDPAERAHARKVQALQAHLRGLIDQVNALWTGRDPGPARDAALRAATRARRVLVMDDPGSLESAAQTLQRLLTA